MSEVRVNNIVDYGGKGAPTFDNGAVISGVSSLGNQAKIGSNVTITSGGINVSGVTTAATLSGNLTGDVNSGFVTATSAVIGSGVTINAGGLNITGVVTATTFEGSGASMTGVAMTITPLVYNPDVNDSTVATTSGIGITFDHRILAGSGNITLSVATNAGVAGTVVENFGVGSSVTIQGRKATIDPTSDLTAGETYYISYPSGAFTNTSGDVSYVGTAYTFGVKPDFYELWVWGDNEEGALGQNSRTFYSSPVQLPGSWTDVSTNVGGGGYYSAAKKDDTWWVWGRNTNGELGLNSTVSYSSPVQIPGTTWSELAIGEAHTLGLKTNGTLWSWGHNDKGALGLNQADGAKISSPTQIPGTTWSKLFAGATTISVAQKSDGTLWSWGGNFQGQLGDGSTTYRSSPVQIPGTTWSWVSPQGASMIATRTDGTLWAWGSGYWGATGQNNRTYYSSPRQIPGTTWATGDYSATSSHPGMSMAVKTDGTLWVIGRGNSSGGLGVNNQTQYSSPVQVPGTTWSKVFGVAAQKTDGTLWQWGDNGQGQLGQNNVVDYSSPVQIPGTTWFEAGGSGGNDINSSSRLVIKKF